MLKLMGYRILLPIVMITVYGCSDSSHPVDYPIDYLGTWNQEIPVEGSISSQIINSNGQPDTLTTVGKITFSLEILEDGTLNSLGQFTTTDSPCSTQNPCILNSTSYFSHEYLGSETTQEGLTASHLRISNESDNNSADGYAYVSESRLCLSNNLGQMLGVPHNANNSEPLALYFDNCFIKQ